MSPSLGLQMASAVAFVVAYWIWTAWYRRSLDLRLRQALGRRLGLEIEWRRSASEWLTGHSLGAASWNWDAGPQAPIWMQAVVGTLGWLAVVMLGVGPLALFAVPALFLRLMNPLVAYLALVAALPIFTVGWARGPRRGA